ncbi:hypothetical protein U0070_009613 [Myodes glareolus]|uniref:Uncharacterized protein n=1 Tax=Myodes glareolus TaxID=447135 RepID=A0AAW0IJU9_MYOGA
MQADSEETIASYAGHGGFVFTTDDLTEIKGMLLANEVPAASGAKAIVSCEVTLPSQNSGPEPSSRLQTSPLTSPEAHLKLQWCADGYDCRWNGS